MKTFATHIYIFLCLIAFLAVGQACIDDKGNYDYEVLSRAVIANASTGVAEYVYVTPNSILHIEPSITYTEGKGYGDYAYEWHRYDVYFNTEEIFYSETSVLNITLPTSMNKSGSYDLMFIATNNQTGIRYFKRYSIVVRNVMQAGYLALVEKSDGLEVEMIANFNDTLTLYRNLLQLTESKYPRAGRKPLGLATFPDASAPSPSDLNASRVKYSVYLITDKGTDRLKPEDYSFIENDYNISRVSLIAEKFIPTQGLIPEKMEYYHGTSGHYIYLNKNWFFASRQVMLYFFMDPINSPYGTTTYYTAAPYLVNGSQSAVLYDMDHNRFMHQRAGTMDLYASKECMSSRALTDNEGDKYKFNDPDYELVYMGDIRPSTTSTAFGVLRHKATGAHEVWTFSYTSTSVTKTDRFILPASPAYSTVKFIVHHPTEKYLYCATEDKLYMFSTTTLNLTAIDISDIVPAGEKISLLKTIHSSKVGNRVLFTLATYDPAKPIDECGSVRMFTTDSYTGKFVPANHPETPTANGYQIEMKWTGLGKVAAWDYKQQ